MDKKAQEIAAEVKAARPELNGQEFKNVVYQGITLEDYKVARDALVISYSRYKEGKPLSWCSISGYPAVRLTIPATQLHYANRDVTSYKPRSDKIGRTIKVHLLVAETWLDMDSCPEDLEPWWPTIPLEFKKALRPYFQVDHIDNVKINSHIDNLRFTSARVNNAIIKADPQNQEIKLDTALKI